ncbi:MAG TPA: DUF2089 domain-containing protein [Chloroflexota bacterium]|nr:DUF2089 domain-containing protein [Chloroflexota bacterium]HUM68356.1 DUF2089 domain-containing protein [Chloroflexota bacterium]
MRKLLEQCPACAGELIVTQQTCVQCGTSVIGEFQPTIFSRLSPENLAFLEVFIKNKGNVKEMERELGESYWAIRNRINEIIEQLGLEKKNVEPAEAQANMAAQRQEILARLDRGEIDVNTAADLLRAIKPG